MNNLPVARQYPPFVAFICGNKRNRIYLWSALLISVLLFFIFKFFYPYPNMVMDSYIYVKAAYLNMGANSFPIGYSRFLQLFHFFTHSATALVWFQYLFLELACLWLFYTILYLFKPGRWISLLLFLFLFMNPLLLYMANFVMADTLFTAVSLLWLTQLIWIIWHPRAFMILTHGVLIVLAFAIRYNALYYPIFATLVFLVCRMQPLLKAAGIAFQFLLIGGFIIYTSNQMRGLSGVRQFSPFGGWKLANCALYMYGHVYKEDHGVIPKKFEQLDSVVRDYFDKGGKVDVILDYRSVTHGSFYMSTPGSPLFTYMDLKYGTDTVFQNFRKWGPAGAVYGEYGSWLVRHHPVSYFRYYVGPNLIRYYLPPAEIFEYLSPYYLRSDDLGRMARGWFDLKTLSVPMPLIRFRTTILSPFSYSVMLIHLLFLLYFVYFLFSDVKQKVSRQYRTTIYFIALIFLADCFFNASASGVVMRYTIFIMVVELIFSFVLVDLFLKSPKVIAIIDVAETDKTAVAASIID